MFSSSLSCRVSEFARDGLKQTVQYLYKYGHRRMGWVYMSLKLFFTGIYSRASIQGWGVHARIFQLACILSALNEMS